MYATPGPEPSPETHWPAAPPPQFVAPAPNAPLPAFLTPAIDPRARTAGLAVLVSAAVVALATVTKSWFVAGSDAGVGLLGLEACRRGMCQSTSWFDVPLVPSHFAILATTALIACSAAAGLLVHSGIMLLRGSPERVRLRWLAHAVTLALMGVTSFVVTLSLGDWSRGLSLGWSTIVAFAGLVGAAITTGVAVRPLAHK